MGKYILIMLVMASSAGVFGQTANLFTAATNGTFETAGNENTFVNGSGGNFVYTRSSTIKYAGGWSLKINSASGGSTNRFMKLAAGTGSNPTFFVAVKARIYVSSTAPLGPNTKISIETMQFLAGSTGGHNINVCSEKSFRAGIDPYNQWVDIYSDGVPLGSPLDVHIMVDDIAGAAEFYIDNIELIGHGTIDTQSSVDYVNRNILLNPVGFVGGVSTTTFTYLWSDGSTQEDRFALPPALYDVRVSPVGVERPCTRIQQFGFTCINTLNLCGNATGTLTAGCDQPSTTYTWFATEFSPTPIGTGASLPVGPLSPGTYYYWVQPALSGNTYPRVRATVNAYAIPAPSMTPSATTVFLGSPITFTVSNHVAGNNYQFTYLDGTPQTVNSTTAATNITIQHTGTYTITVVTTKDGCSNTPVQFNNIQVVPATALCATTIPFTASGTMQLDKYAGQFVLTPSGGCPESFVVGCVSGKVESSLLSNVVLASATAYSDQWSSAFVKVPLPIGLNTVEKNERGKWRPHSMHSFNKPVNYQLADKNYEAGRFQLSAFYYKKPEVNRRIGWLASSSVEKYTPDGDAVQERNALNIASAAKVGYGRSLPYLVAQNAEYGSVYFESFENVYNANKFEEGVLLAGGPRASDYYHSGKFSLSLTSYFTSVRLTVNKQMRDKGMQVRFWAKGDVAVGAITVGVTALTAGGPAAVQPTVSNPMLKVIARSGEWALLESTVTGISAASDEFSVTIGKGTGGAVWIDDVRIQPMDAEMSCYVHDNRTLQLLVTFDVQHFGMFFQYNTEGKLIRKMVETERGIKTVEEKQYNLQTISKSAPLVN